MVVLAGYRYSQRWQSCAWRGQLVAAAVGCRDYWRLPRHSKHGPCMSRIFRIIVSVKVVVVCIVIRLPWQRVFASEGVLLSESSVVTCESRPLYLSLSLRAWDCVASARRGLPPLGRKKKKFTYRSKQQGERGAATVADIIRESGAPCQRPAQTAGDRGGIRSAGS